MAEIVSLHERRKQDRQSQETRRLVLRMLFLLDGFELATADMALEEVRRRVYWWAFRSADAFGRDYPVAPLPNMKDAIEQIMPMFANLPFRRCLDVLEVAMCTLWVRACGIPGSDRRIPPDEVVSFNDD